MCLSYVSLCNFNDRRQCSVFEERVSNNSSVALVKHHIYWGSDFFYVFHGYKLCYSFKKRECIT